MPFKTVGGDDRSPPLPKGLSLSSRKRADNTIKGMYRYLHGAGYLAQNPAFLLSGLTGAEVSQDDLERIGVSPERYVRRLKQQAIANDNRAESKALSADLWVWLCEFLDASENTWRIPEIPSSPLPSTANPAWKLERRERLRCIMLFGHASASRRSELTDSMMSSVVLSDRRWVWKVLGKGRNPSESPDRVVLTKTAINALGRYRLVRGLPEFPSAAEESEPLIAKLTPVRPRQHGIGSLKTGRGVTAGYLNTELQRFLSFAAGFVPEGRERWAVQLRTAASHSLRHTCGTHYALAGLSMDDAAKHLRHKDPRTTAKHYTHLTDDERGQSVDAMERLLSGKRKNQPPDA
jgi:integrase